MAVELEKFLSEQLTSLPSRHPDRTFLRGVLQVTRGYLRQPTAEDRMSIIINPLHREIDALRLNNRVRNALARNQIDRIDQVIFLQDDLPLMRDISQKGAAEVREGIGRYLGSFTSEEDVKSVEAQREEIERFRTLGWTRPTRFVLADLRITTINALANMSWEELNKLNLSSSVLAEIRAVK